MRFEPADTIIQRHLSQPLQIPEKPPNSPRKKLYCSTSTAPTCIILNKFNLIYPRRKKAIQADEREIVENCKCMLGIENVFYVPLLMYA